MHSIVRTNHTSATLRTLYSHLPSTPSLTTTAGTSLTQSPSHSKSYTAKDDKRHIYRVFLLHEVDLFTLFYAYQEYIHPLCFVHLHTHRAAIPTLVQYLDQARTASAPRGTETRNASLQALTTFFYTVRDVTSASDSITNCASQRSRLFWNYDGPKE